MFPYPPKAKQTGIIEPPSPVEERLGNSRSCTAADICHHTIIIKLALDQSVSAKLAAEWAYRRQNIGRPCPPLKLFTSSPSLLSCEPLVEQGEDFRDVESDVLKIQVLLSLLLHLKQIVELEIELEKASTSPYTTKKSVHRSLCKT